MTTGEASAPSALEAEIRDEILREGPIPVARYMALCLGHPRHGYYVARDPFGAAGDFTTAPEISQMFGELLGLWAVAAWQAMGAPTPFRLIELGPGRGTLMADALRAASLVPAFREAAAVHLVETSPALRARQRETLRGLADPVWHDALATVPPGAFVLLANEFLDALPIHQAVKAEDGWYERVVGLDERGRLAFGLAPMPLADFATRLPPDLESAPLGAVFEWRSDTLIAELGERMLAHPGAALFIDYGHGRSGFGDTLQAVRRHGFADPLQAPGEADLTAHVDFAALVRVAARAGVTVHGPAGQGAFLKRLGIEARAAKLRASATPPQRDAIDAALARLTGSGPSEMGALFKALALTSPGLPAPPGFDS